MVGCPAYGVSTLQDVLQQCCAQEGLETVFPYPPHEH